MSTEPNERAALFARLREAYAPSESDAQRVRAKIDESLRAEAEAPRPAETMGSRTFLERLGLSSIAVLIAGGVLVYQATAERKLPAASAPLAPTVAASLSTSPAPTSSAPVAPPPDEAPQSGLLVPAVSVDALPSAPPIRPAAPIAQASRTADDTLEREARLLADARRALQAGETERALVLLDEHARVFPNGFLASDRAAERIDVLCRLGRRDDAVRAAKVFLEGHPKTPLAYRVKTSCAGHDEE
jgi:RNA polymerase sigma-70 factor (ECF subfamily)